MQQQGGSEVLTSAAASCQTTILPTARTALSMARAKAMPAKLGEIDRLENILTAIRNGSRLERAFRDIYTGTQHAFISEKVAMDAATVWLGLVEDQFAL